MVLVSDDAPAAVVAVSRALGAVRFAGCTELEAVLEERRQHTAGGAAVHSHELTQIPYSTDTPVSDYQHARLT